MRERVSSKLGYEDLDLLPRRAEQSATYLLRRGFAAIMANSAVTVVRIILAIILPPLGVFLKHGIKIEFWICLLLSFLAYLPGIIFAVWVIVK